MNDVTSTKLFTNSANANINYKERMLKERVFILGCIIASSVCCLILAVLLFDIFRDGISYISWDFLTNFPSRKPAEAGLRAAIWGSFFVVSGTAIFAIPVGVGAAIYLEEYAKPGKIKKAIQTNIGNLAGVPSIVYGLLGLQIFVRGTFGYGIKFGGDDNLLMGRSVIAGSLTLGLLILPIIIVAAQEAIRAVPQTIREASYGLGATKWQTIRGQVLPAAIPGIMTGVILSLSRAIGETAPLIMIGALTYVAFVPTGPLSAFTAMPIQIYNWVARPQVDFHDLAAAGIVVLMDILLLANTLAIFLRNKYHQKW